MLNRLISHVCHHVDDCLVGYIGDSAENSHIGIFVDADRGDGLGVKAPSGAVVVLLGPETFFPLAVLCKKQTSFAKALHSGKTTLRHSKVLDVSIVLAKTRFSVMRETERRTIHHICSVERLIRLQADFKALDEDIKAIYEAREKPDVDSRSGLVRYECSSSSLANPAETCWIVLVRMLNEVFSPGRASEEGAERKGIGASSLFILLSTSKKSWSCIVPER